MNDVINLLRGKIILNIFSFQGLRTLKPISKIHLKKSYFFAQFKNGQKLGFNTPLRVRFPLPWLI